MCGHLSICCTHVKNEGGSKGTPVCEKGAGPRGGACIYQEMGYPLDPTYYTHVQSTTLQATSQTSGQPTSRYKLFTNPFKADVSYDPSSPQL